MMALENLSNAEKVFLVLVVAIGSVLNLFFFALLTFP
jgi:hypothetical protein